MTNTERTTMSKKQEIDHLAETLTGLSNDARYWDLRRTYGDYSDEVLSHLRACETVQARDANHA